MDFLHLDIGNILTIIALLVSFWTAHAANVKRIKEATQDFQEIKTKVDLLYDWFRNNVVGRGERSRSFKQSKEDEEGNR